MVAVWFPVTAGAERRPPELIVPMFVLQVAVAVYVDVAPSFTDAAPLIAMLVSVAVTFTMFTVTAAVRVTPPEV